MSAAVDASRKQRNKEVYNKVYVLCPSCGRPAVFDFKNVRINGMFICGPECPGRNDENAATGINTLQMLTRS